MEIISIYSFDEQKNESLQLTIKTNQTEKKGLQLSFGDSAQAELGRRKYGDVTLISKALELAYEAGKSGENLQISLLDESDNTDEEES